MAEGYRDDILSTIIADVWGRARMERVFAEFRPEVVFHTAAPKHAPLMEQHPDKVVKNNIYNMPKVVEIALD